MAAAVGLVPLSSSLCWHRFPPIRNGDENPNQRSLSLSIFRQFTPFPASILPSLGSHRHCGETAPLRGAVQGPLFLPACAYFFSGIRRSGGATPAVRLSLPLYSRILNPNIKIPQTFIPRFTFSSGYFHFNIIYLLVTDRVLFCRVRSSRWKRHCLLYSSLLLPPQTGLSAVEIFVKCRMVCWAGWLGKVFG